MQASNRRQAALSESQRGFAVSTHAFMKSRANTQQPTWLPNGGAGRLDGTSEPARLTEGVLFDEWQQLKITNATPFAAIAALPPKGAARGWYEFALVHFKWYSAYRKPLRHAYARPSSALH